MARKINEYSEQIPDPREQRTAKSPEDEAQDKRGEMVDLLKSMSNALDALVYYATPSRGIAKPGIEKSIGSSITQLGGMSETQIKGSELKQIVAEELSKILNEQGNPAYLSTPGNPVDRDGDGYPDHYDTRGAGVSMPGEEGNRYNARKAMRAQRRKYPDIPLPPVSVTPNEDNPIFVSADAAAPAGPAPGPITPQPDLGSKPPDQITDPAAIMTPASVMADTPVAAMFRRQVALDNQDPSWSAYLGSKQAQESGSKGASAENRRTKAYGLFQVMPNNWEPWRKEAEKKYGLPEGSLADRKNAQNQYLVSRAKMQDYYDEFAEYGDDSPTGSVWGDIAAAWYTGGRRVRGAHRAKKAMNAGEKPSGSDAWNLSWLQKMGKGDGVEKGVGKNEPWVGQYVDDVVKRMAKVGGNPDILASVSMLAPDYENQMQEMPPAEAGDEPPQMMHVPGRGFVAVDDLEAEKEAEEIQFQPVIIDTVADDFVEPHDSENVARRIALGMLEPEEGPDTPDTAAVDVNYGGGTPVQYDTVPPVEPAEYVGTPPPPAAPAMDADTQDALVRTPDTDDSRRGSAASWCPEGEIQIQGQCVNIAQLLGGLAENKQNLKELVKEEIKQLIISKNLDLKGN